MTIEDVRRWSIGPPASDNAVGAALRAAIGCRPDRLPKEFTLLLRKLDGTAGGERGICM